MLEEYHPAAIKTAAKRDRINSPMVVSFAGAALARPRFTSWTCNNSALDQPFPSVLGRWHVKKSCRERRARERREQAVRGTLILAPTMPIRFQRFCAARRHRPIYSSSSTVSSKRKRGIFHLSRKAYARSLYLRLPG